MNDLEFLHFQALIEVKKMENDIEYNSEVSFSA